MKILVVDDAPFIVRALRDTLAARGFEVHEAQSGEEAISAYRDLKPDVVLMDILMPGMDGLSATREILNIDPAANIIVITAIGKPGLEKECMDAGAKGFLMKPFRARALMELIDSFSGRGGR
ncbi:MAG: response regulator [Methanothrix sp.]|uniref:response regulator n=1 Tax=Methanothrix sp. TaxID=90426 RepID=UPI0025F646A6|nr:response regulator [Methanothrix sp.]MCQ8902521.1 response regulator [Methanothrix sp.]